LAWADQKCSALSRLYVHRDVADALHEKLVQRIAALHIGDPALQENWLGPVTTQAGYDNYAATRHCFAPGGRVLSGGEQLRAGNLAAGLFVRPTLAEAAPDHPPGRRKCSCQYSCRSVVSSNGEAMQLANHTPWV